MRALRMLALGIVMAGGLAAAAAPVLAQRQGSAAYPVRPIRMISGAYGSPSDTLARTIAPKMSERWGQPVIVENRPGASGTIGANIVAHAAPDGYTLLLISAQFAITAVLQPNLTFDPLKDFAGVTQIGYSTSTLTVNPSLGVKTLKEFISYAQARPGQIFFSSGGAGSSTHINAERFREAAGIKAVHVGFKGTPDALLEVVAGRVHYCIVGLSAQMPFIKDGRVLALAVSTPQRSPLLPDVPAMAEILPGFGRDGSHSLLAPAKTPRPVLIQISREVARIFDLPDVKERLQAMGYTTAPTTPEEHDRILREQIGTFGEIARRIGLKAH